MGDVKRFGEDPSAAGFGGWTFTSADGRWGPADSVSTHPAYWNRDNLSRRDIAAIITGKTTEVH